MTIGNKVITIAVMGATGTGKSSFINTVSGSNLKVGHGQRSCTASVQVSPQFSLFGRQIVLLDTPGFDDTTQSDTDILNLIATYLAQTYREGTKLSGIIYMHRITDVRLGGVSRRNFGMFRSLCGDSTLQNVIILTNMWRAPDDAVGCAREHELATDPALFQPVLKKGARMLRHYGTHETAHAVLRQLVGNAPVVLQIQDEVVNQQRTVEQTAAAARLEGELQEQRRRHEEEMRSIAEVARIALEEQERQGRVEAERLRLEMEENARREQEMHNLLLAQQAAERRRVEEEQREIQRRIEAEAEAARLYQAEVERMRREEEAHAAAAAAEQEVLRRQMEELERQRHDRGGGGCVLQ